MLLRFHPPKAVYPTNAQLIFCVSWFSLEFVWHASDRSHISNSWICSQSHCHKHRMKTQASSVQNYMSSTSTGCWYNRVIPKHSSNDKSYLYTKNKQKVYKCSPTSSHFSTRFFNTSAATLTTIVSKRGFKASCGSVGSLPCATAKTGRLQGFSSQMTPISTPKKQETIWKNEWMDGNCANIDFFGGKMNRPMVVFFLKISDYGNMQAVNLPPQSSTIFQLYVVIWHQPVVLKCRGTFPSNLYWKAKLFGSEVEPETA